MLLIAAFGRSVARSRYGTTKTMFVPDRNVLRLSPRPFGLWDSLSMVAGGLVGSRRFRPSSLPGRPDLMASLVVLLSGGGEVPGLIQGWLMSMP